MTPKYFITSCDADIKVNYMNPYHDLKQKIFSETARVSWTELETFYAKGNIIWVSEQLDLIEMALKFAEDDTAAIQNYLVSGDIEKMTPVKATQWHQQQPQLWATVVAPWILVQQRPSK